MDWQPIETAPHEVDILVAAFHDIPLHDKYWAWIMQGRFLEGQPKTVFFNSYVDEEIEFFEQLCWNKPTHWAKLPEFPKEL